MSLTLMANQSSQSRFLPVGLTDATLGGLYASHRGEGGKPRVEGTLVTGDGETVCRGAESAEK